MAEGKYDDKSVMAQMQAEIYELKQALAEVANANLISSSLDKGFQSLMAELQPLRDLTPQREPLKEHVGAALAGMLKAMEGIKLAGGSLGIPEVHVPFIGQPLEPAPGSSSLGTPSLPAPGLSDPYQRPDKPTQPPLGGGYRP